MAPLRIYSGHDVFDRAVFSRGVHALQNHQDGPAILGIQLFLQCGETRDPMLQRFFRLLFGLEPERLAGAEILQAEMRSVHYPEWLGKFAKFHDFALSFLTSESVRFTSVCRGAGQ